MTTVDPDFAAKEAKEARRERLFTRINKADSYLRVLVCVCLYLG